MKKKILLYLICLCNFASAQKPEITKLDKSKISIKDADSIITKVMRAANVQGLDIAILNNSKTSFIKSYGYRNKPANKLLDTATIVYAASFSKAVFSYLTMKLVQENILDLDKPLYQYLSKSIGYYPYFSVLENDDRWKLITARMCLNHTTGLPNVRIFNPITSELDTTAQLKIYFPPGSKYAYSGEGFKLLQLVEEEITGKTLDELSVEKIFKPLGMNRTGYIWHDSFGDDNVAVGHFNNGAIDIKRKRTVGVAGGSLVTTIADYAKFIEQIIQRKGLKRNLFNEMISPQVNIYSKTQFPPITFEITDENRDIKLAYGLGWGLIECKKYGKAFFKEGNGDSWRNYNINFIDQGISIIIMTNSENGENIFQELIEKLIGETCIPWKWQGYIPYNARH